MSNRIKNKLENSITDERKMRIQLKDREEEFVYNPTERIFTFYQICGYALKKKYNIRKLKYNEYCELIDYTETAVKKDVVGKFVKKCPTFKYSIYPTYELNVVEFPKDNEILTAQSQILNGSI